MLYSLAAHYQPFLAIHFLPDERRFLKFDQFERIYFQVNNVLTYSEMTMPKKWFPGHEIIKSKEYYLIAASPIL